MMSGEVHVGLGEAVLFRNSSVFRPAMVALLAAVLASGSRYASRLGAVLIVAAMLPASGYAQNMAMLDDGRAPLRTMRDCLLRVEASMSAPPPGLYVDVPDTEMRHPVYYYFRRV